MSAALFPFIDALRQFKLLTPAQLQELENLPSSVADPKTLAQELMQRRWLTPYQANRLLQAKGPELLLGSYVLLERLGEGGMGEVFKARNWKLNNIVALKLIHKDRVANPDALKRFQREVRAAAQLNHPNVVVAYDADAVGGAHLLVMEYVEGSDLAGLVEKHGPLSVDRACDFIRQAALGLQHSYEKGLVHRDVKPSNLLLARGAVVKILDMGLARLDALSTDDDATGTMTQEGAIVGTPDFIAPEQAMDSHKVDVRGDIYSLGCTFYFLLTGHVPFPGGTMMEKLFKQRLEEPQPVEEFRADVPPGVAAILRKMTAKLPEDRYQTPGAVAAALLAVSGSPETRAERGVVQRPVPATVGETADTELLVASRPRWRWLALTMAGGGLLLGALALLVGLLLWRGSPPEQARTTAGPPPVVEGPRDTLKKLDEVWLKRVVGLPPEEQVRAVAAKLKELNPEFDGKVEHRIEKGAVTALTFLTDHVTDVSPVRALTGLRALHCAGSLGKGRLADLSPLQELKLTTLNCASTQASDLSPLHGMPLTHLDCAGTKVSDLSPLRGMSLTTLACNSTPVSDLSPLHGMPLTEVYCHFTRVSDLAPLKDMKLTKLFCAATNVTDLAPLKNMKLTTLMCNFTRVSDLAPLKGMSLTDLNCGVTQVADLSPLKGMPLVSLRCDGTAVADLSPLKEMKLTYLDCGSTLVSDLSPLHGMPLTTLRCFATRATDLSPLEGMKLAEVRFTPQNISKGTDVLRRMPSLKYLGVGAAVKDAWPADEFWAKLAAGEFQRKGLDEAWLKRVAGLSPEEQVQAVAAKLKELNPDFDGKVESKIEKAAVTALTFSTDNVTDVSPVRALTALRSLNCSGTAGTGRLADLSPLKNLNLTTLNCGGTQVSDLSPLQRLPLTNLYCGQTKVSNLSPLKDLKLTYLSFPYTQVVDLSPLENMKLTSLECYSTPVADLSPLKGMPLTNLHCGNTKVVDLAPLKNMKLTRLSCAGTQVSDLSPLKRMPLTYLNCAGTPVADLSPLKDAKLTTLYCGNTKVADLSPLHGMPLTILGCHGTPVSDLAPLVGAKLEDLRFTPQSITRGMNVLRQMHSLKTIGSGWEAQHGWPAAEFWKKLEAGEFK